MTFALFWPNCPTLSFLPLCVMTTSSSVFHHIHLHKLIFIFRLVIIISSNPPSSILHPLFGLVGPRKLLSKTGMSTNPAVPLRSFLFYSPFFSFYFPFCLFCFSCSAFLFPPTVRTVRFAQPPSVSRFSSRICYKASETKHIRGGTRALATVVRLNQGRRVHKAQEKSETRR